MDQLSLAAGVIAIVMAAAQTSKAISRLRTFGEVPGRAYALKNGVNYPSRSCSSPGCTCIVI